LSRPFNHLVSAARALVIFVAVMGFFLGQILLGEISIWKSLAGLLGIVAAGAVGLTSDRLRISGIAIAAICALAAIAVMLDARDYFERYTLARNTYPWFLTGPYVLGLVLIAVKALRR
jgi:hypothetical protein